MLAVISQTLRGTRVDGKALTYLETRRSPERFSSLHLVSWLCLVRWLHRRELRLLRHATLDAYYPSVRLTFTNFLQAVPHQHLIIGRGEQCCRHIDED